MLASNTFLQHRYRIVRQLGQGGMGTVYEAIDERLSCVVALKQTLATSESDAGRAFEREAILLANLRHPLLPKVMDHFIEGEGQFLVMEFIHGHDLAELLSMRATPFATAQVLEWADELLKVLEYLHGRQPPILHRDIKPANLKLTKQNELFVLDFGLAKGAAGQMPTLLTSRSVHGYTPVYASLEQIHGKGTDPRSDLYSLGATLYHLLTGTKPIDAPSRFAELEDERPDPLLPIDSVNSEVSPGIAGVIQQAMSVSRKHRHANAATMRSALREAGGQHRRQAEAEGTQRHTEQETTDKNLVAQTLPAKDATTPVGVPDTKTLKGERAQFYPNAGPSYSAQTHSTDEKVKTHTGKRRYRALLIVVSALLGVAVIVGSGWLLLQIVQMNTITSPSASSTPIGKPFRNRIGIDMVWIPEGSFEMGSNNGVADEVPARTVRIGQSFYIGKYEVTQGQWLALMDNNPSMFTGDQNLPVEWVSWNDAQNFISKLNDQKDGYVYRLPTEAEWEYACRAGTTGAYYSDDVSDIGWYVNNSEAKTHTVGSKRANAFGLYDMSGNVWEWCADWYVGSYEGAPTDGSARLSGGEQTSRVRRGGSWSHPATVLRSSERESSLPDSRFRDLGFRLAAVERSK